MHALRGAITVDADDAGEIVAATATLLGEMLERNGVPAGDVISLVFTSTPDLTAEFPAAAARRVGMDDVPLLCATEIDVPGALPRCIRVLMHLYAEGGLEHVYLRDARRLKGHPGR